jgi:3-oxoacyl-[acyl-carrier-protein] synthase III
MTGFGIGLSWGVVTAEINTNDIYPIILTDEYYKEGAVKHD